MSWNGSKFALDQSGRGGLCACNVDVDVDVDVDVGGGAERAQFLGAPARTATVTIENWGVASN